MSFKAKKMGVLKTKDNNNQMYCLYLDWTLDIKRKIYKRYFCNNWRNLNIDYILDDIMELLMFLM